MSYNAATGAFETTCRNPTCGAKVTIPSVELENLRTGERLPRKLCAKCEAEKLIIRGDEETSRSGGPMSPQDRLSDEFLTQLRHACALPQLTSPVHATAEWEKLRERVTEVLRAQHAADQQRADEAYRAHAASFSALHAITCAILDTAELDDYNHAAEQVLEKFNALAAERGRLKAAEPPAPPLTRAEAERRLRDGVYDNELVTSHPKTGIWLVPDWQTVILDALFPPAPEPPEDPDR